MVIIYILAVLGVIFILDMLWRLGAFYYLTLFLFYIVPNPIKSMKSYYHYKTRTGQWTGVPRKVWNLDDPDRSI